MNIKLEIIENPTVNNVTSDTITGTLPTGDKVIVTRVLHGWEVWLKISVNDHMAHYSEARPQDRTAYDMLRRRAIEAMSDAHSAVSHKARAAAMQLFGN